MLWLAISCIWVNGQGSYNCYLSWIAIGTDSLEFGGNEKGAFVPLLHLNIYMSLASLTKHLLHFSAISAFETCTLFLYPLLWNDLENYAGIAHNVI